MTFRHLPRHLLCLSMLACQTSRLPDPDPLLFARLDRDRSGLLEGAELAGLAEDELQSLDANRSGGVDERELAQFFARPPNSVLRMNAHQRGKVRRYRGKRSKAGMRGPPGGGPPGSGPPSLSADAPQPRPPPPPRGPEDRPPPAPAPPPPAPTHGG